MADKLSLDLVAACRVASPHDAVYNAECVYTFHSCYTTDAGIVVNLTSFMGTVESRALQKDKERGLFLRIVKKRVFKQRNDELVGANTKGSSGPPTKLAVGVAGGFASDDDKYDTISTYSIVQLERVDGLVAVVVEIPYTNETKESLPNSLVLSADSVLHHSGMAIQQDLKVWELDDEPSPISKYAAGLPFVDNGVVISPDPSTWKCAKSGDTENLWLNLSDGYIGGGRKNWDGSGGSNGALDHFLETGETFPLVVKLGTITADLDTADCYSYAKDEDGLVKIPNLAELLEQRGIHVSAMQKTVKSTAELEVELNATYAFDAITEAGAHLVPVSGPGLQGLQNLGNSCYMNSVLQLLLSGTVPELATRYGRDQTLLSSLKPTKAPSDLLCQTTKIASALTSGDFAASNTEASSGDEDESSLNPKYRLQPRMFKHVVAGDHEEFRTGQQQDAAQFLQYMLGQLDRAEQGAAATNRLPIKVEDTIFPSSYLFSFKTNSRLVCKADDKVKYKEGAPETIWSMPIPMKKGTILEEEPEQKRHKPDEQESKSDVERKPVPTVTFHACLESWAADRAMDDYRWPHLQKQVHPTIQQLRFQNFPRYLLVQMQRYQLGADWTPQKLEVNLDIPEELDLSALKFTGPRDGESLVPPEDDSPTATTAMNGRQPIDEGALIQLMDMGFHMNGCKRALTAVGGSDVEAAMNWVFEHNSDPDFSEPLPDPDAAPVGSKDGVDEGVVASLVESLGCFTMDQVRAALKETNGAADRAADWLFSHMDDLDGAIASLSDTQPAVSSSALSLPLDDGIGEYAMIGMVSHIGKHTGSGHYVAHLKRGDKWVIFNDEKVALSESPPFAHAYMYLFQRKDTFDSPHQGY